MKKIASLITAIALTATAAACSAPQESGTETSDTTETTTSATTTTETTYIIDSDPVDDTPETEYVEMPVFEPMEIDFETADRGRIIPCVGGFVENKWYKENDVAYFSFVTLDGEVLCSALFNFAYYAEDAKTYIVRRTDTGVSKYGFLSDDGAVFTGLIYDGAAVAQGSKADGVCFYGTNYADGYLWVSSLDKDLNVIDTARVTIDEEEISLVAETAQLSVIYIDETSTVMINRNQFYYKTMIIDNASGKLLHDDSSSGFRDPHIFGKVYIELEYTGAGLAVYDIRGNQLLDDKEAYAGFITDDLFMISRNNEISIYDTDWQVVNSLSVPSGSIVMSSFGRIAVADGTETRVYDKDLVLINTLDYSVDTGTYLRDWRNYGEGDMFYDTISGDAAKIINLNTGAMIVKEYQFIYDFKEGYIIASNMYYGNVETYKWRVYDKDLNRLFSGEGYIEVFSDSVTGDVYMVIENDGLLTVYSLPDGRELFSFTGNRYTLEAIDGRFYCWDTDRCVLMDSNGEEILSMDVSYHVTG